MGRPRKGETPVERLLRYCTRDEDGCLLYSHTDAFGYGDFTITCLPSRVRMKAHRYVWLSLVGPPEGQIDHECHNIAVREGRCSGGICKHRRCVEPSHLRDVSARTNILAGDTLASANQQKEACPQGHPYDDVNTY